MFLDVRQRGDCNTMSQLIQWLVEQDSGPRSIATLQLLTKGNAINLPVFSAGQTPAYWVLSDGANMIVVVAGATTAREGLDLIGGAMIPGIPVGIARCNAAAVIQAQIIEAVVTNLVPSFPQRVLAVGHSYGGAIAHVLAAGWHQFQPNLTVQLYTQGSPRVGDVRLAAVLDNIDKLRVMNFGDPVCFFPPHFAEAPFATIALGFIQAYNLSFWAHAGGGTVLDNQGNLYGSELPPISLIINDTSLLAWAAGVNGFLNSEHDSATYLRRMTNQGPAAPAPPVDPFRAGFKGELALPLTPAELAAGPINGPLLQEGKGTVAFSSVFIPVAYRWKPVKIGQVWWATWQGLQVVACQSHSQAKSICKAFNKSLKVLQNASSVSKGIMLSTWGSYLVAAGASTAGFTPVLTVLP
jgi:hypothetical protein